MTSNSAINDSSYSGPFTSANPKKSTGLDRTPRIHAHDKPEKPQNADYTIYSFRVKLSFTIPAYQNVYPREKFAALLSVISSQFPGTALEK